MNINKAFKKRCLATDKINIEYTNIGGVFLSGGRFVLYTNSG